MAERRRIFLPRPVRGDWPAGHHVVAPAGWHWAEVNPHGALAVPAADGSLLGIKPGEFLWEDRVPPEWSAPGVPIDG